MATLKIRKYDSFNGDESFFSLNDILPLSYCQFYSLVHNHYVEVDNYIDGVYCPITFSFYVYE